MRARTLALIVPSLVLAGALACSREPEPKPETGSAPAEPAPAPVAAEPEPAPPEPSPASTEAPEPATEDPGVLDADPVMAERKQALANVGRSAFEALEAGDFAKHLALTPLSEGPLKTACAKMPVSKRAELEARFEHCHEQIPWAEIAEAQAFAPKPSGTPALGCEAGIEDYGRLLLFLHMNDESIWRVEFFGAVGQDGNVVGLNGEVACKQVDRAPELK